MRPEDRAAELRALPRVDELAARLEVPHAVAVQVARDAIDAVRKTLLEGREGPPAEALAMAHLAAMRQPQLKRVINGTGIVIHTNLGRAPLPPALPSLGYCNVEYDLASGHRGSRLAPITPLLEALSGAEASLAVNNTAAALVLALTALRAASDRSEVLISRGELVEIGGSFRIPEIIETSGATLREVGTTNKTRASDYARAISPRTLAILRVHPSNFEILGFQERPEARELIALAHSHELPFLYDLGTDLLGAPALPLPQSTWSAELDARSAIEAGADLVMFSGDKLLGGPQAGIVLGQRGLVAKMAAHPLMRALRLDKVALGLLEQVLRARVLGDWQAVPTLAMLHTPVDALGARARRLARRCEDAGIAVELVPTRDPIGGGSHPGQTLEGVGLAIHPDPMRPVGPNELAARLRMGDPAVVSFIAADRVVIALRTVSEVDEQPLIDALVTALDIPISTL